MPTNYALSGLTEKTNPVGTDYVAILDSEDTTTAPAGPAGSNKKVALSHLLGGGGTLTQYIAPDVVTLTYGTAIPVNAALGNAFNLTLTASTGTIANPTNAVDAQIIRFRITQGSGGANTVSWAAGYDFGNGAAPTLSATAGKVDIVAFEYIASIAKWAYLGTGLGY